MSGKRIDLACELTAVVEAVVRAVKRPNGYHKLRFTAKLDLKGSLSPVLG